METQIKHWEDGGQLTRWTDFKESFNYEVLGFPDMRSYLVDGEHGQFKKCFWVPYSSSVNWYFQCPPQQGYCNICTIYTKWGRLSKGVPFRIQASLFSTASCSWFFVQNSHSQRMISSKSFQQKMSSGGLETKRNRLDSPVEGQGGFLMFPGSLLGPCGHRKSTCNEKWGAIGLPWWHSGWESACQCRGHRFERLHMSRSKWACAPQLLSLRSRTHVPQLLSPSA